MAVFAGEALSQRQSATAWAAALPNVESGDLCSNTNDADGQGLHRAGLVVVFPDGTDMYCVEFAEEEITGMVLLERTGLPLVLSGFGGLGAGVCRIDDVGCSDPGDCFCQCRGADCNFWTYFELDGESWRFLNIGASQRQVRDGTVQGWVWGNGRTTPGSASIDALCESLQPTPQPTRTPQPPVARATRRSPATPAAVLPQPAAVAGTRSTEAPTTASVERTTPLPSAQQTPADVPTPAPRVVRASDRPLSRSEGNSVQGDANEEGGDFPSELVAFSTVALGLVAVTGILVIRRRLHG
jgi:hypothetical protein